jgi:hypothetical protein
VGNETALTFALRLKKGYTKKEFLKNKDEAVRPEIRNLVIFRIVVKNGLSSLKVWKQQQRLS